MKFINYLNESDSKDYNDLLTILEKDCSKYLNILRKSKNQNNILMSGRKSTQKWFQETIRKDRRPKDTPLVIHNMFDDVFQQKTSTRLRSESLFCTNSMGTASSYGKVFIILPVGNYETWYHPNISDLYTYFNRYTIRKELGVLQGLNAYETILEKLEDEWGFQNKFNKYLKMVINGYKKGLPDKLDIEVMLNGNKYYALNADWTQWATNLPGTIRFFDWLWK